MPRIPEKCRLLNGPYQAPALRRAERAECPLRGTVVITRWNDARISWPRCQLPEYRCRPSLLPGAELARAIRTEAARLDRPGLERRRDAALLGNE
jgi:hypothetical protein